MRITSLSGMGVLSFDQFKLSLSERLTFVVGPSGAGKSNLTRLLTIWGPSSPGERSNGYALELR